MSKPLWLLLLAGAHLSGCDCTCEYVPVAPDDSGDTDEPDPEPVDTDGDGLDDETELLLGTNPFAADTDEDGLDDGYEVARGTDPLDPDTDGDGYLDGWEVVEGTDPKDPKSRIYEGGWPYNPDKAALEDPGFRGELQVGDRIWNYVAVDQFGERVQLYDYLGQGKDVFLHAAGAWVGPCKNLANWISSGGAADVYDMEAAYSKARRAVDDGDLYWVTLLVEDENAGPTDGDDVRSWASAYPHDNVAVLADPDSKAHDAIIGVTKFFPTAALLDSEGRVLEVGDFFGTLNRAQTRL